MDDVIYRQALRDAMYHEAFEVDSDMQKWDSGCWIRYKLFENVIDKIPSAQKKGHWKDECSCSVCNWIHEDDHGFALLTDYNFCPNCGADMRGEDDG